MPGNGDTPKRIFNAYLLAQLISSIGNSCQALLVTLSLFGKHQDMDILVLSVLSNLAPRLISMLVLGRFVDKYARRKLLVVTNTTMIMLAVLYGWFVASQQAPVWLLILVIFLGATAAISSTGSQAIAQEVVTSKLHGTANEGENPAIDPEAVKPASHKGTVTKVIAPEADQSKLPTATNEGEAYSASIHGANKGKRPGDLKKKKEDQDARAAARYRIALVIQCGSLIGSGIAGLFATASPKVQACLAFINAVSYIQLLVLYGYQMKKAKLGSTRPVKSREKVSTWKTWRDLKTNKGDMKIYLIVLLMNFTCAKGAIMQPAMAYKLFDGSADLAKIMLGNALAGILVGIYQAWRPYRITTMKGFVLWCLGTMFVAVLQGASPNVTWAIITLIVSGYGVNVIAIGGKTLLVDQAPNNIRGRRQALVDSGANLSVIATTLTCYVMIVLWGTRITGILIPALGIVGLLVAVLWATVRPPKKA